MGAAQIVKFDSSCKTFGRKVNKGQSKETGNLLVNKVQYNEAGIKKKYLID